jgi:hypothetical protein
MGKRGYREHYLRVSLSYFIPSLLLMERSSWADSSCLEDLTAVPTSAMNRLPSAGCLCLYCSLLRPFAVFPLLLRHFLFLSHLILPSNSSIRSLAYKFLYELMLSQADDYKLGPFRNRRWLMIGTSTMTRLLAILTCCVRPSSMTPLLQVKQLRITYAKGEFTWWSYMTDPRFYRSPVYSYLHQNRNPLF